LRGTKYQERGRRIKLGKTLALGEAEVISEENTILAHGTSTLMILRNLGGALKHSLPRKFIEEE
jgi:acyl-coenzyme A thioesterase PaaI-like protein